MSFIPAMIYLSGLAVVGFVMWMLIGIMESFVEIGVHETGAIWTFLNYMWPFSIIIIYLIFGGWWVIRKYNEQQYQQGGMM